MAMYTLLNVVYLRALPVAAIAASTAHRRGRGGGAFRGGRCPARVARGPGLELRVPCRDDPLCGTHLPADGAGWVCSSARSPMFTRATGRPAGACSPRVCGRRCSPSPGPQPALHLLDVRRDAVPRGDRRRGLRPAAHAARASRPYRVWGYPGGTGALHPAPAVSWSRTRWPRGRSNRSGGWVSWRSACRPTPTGATAPEGPAIRSFPALTGQLSSTSSERRSAGPGLSPTRRPRALCSPLRQRLGPR